jgi:hypothetical protein
MDSRGTGGPQGARVPNWENSTPKLRGVRLPPIRSLGQKKAKKAALEIQKTLETPTRPQGGAGRLRPDTKVLKDRIADILTLDMSGAQRTLKDALISNPDSTVLDMKASENDKKDLLAVYHSLTSAEQNLQGLGETLGKQ